MEHALLNPRLEEMIRALRGADTVAIVRLGSIGDVIATLPFAWFMRDILRPETRIVWIAHPAPGNLIQRVKALDEIVTLPRGSFFKTISIWRRILRKINADAVVDLHGNSKSGLVTRLIGARVRIGFDRKDCREILNCLATNRKLPPLSTANKTLRAVEVARLLGHPNPAPRFDLEFTPAEMQRAKTVLESWDLQASSVILVQLGRLQDVRSWPCRNFAELTAALSSQGCNVVVLGGPDELDAGRVFRELLGTPNSRIRLEIGTLSLREVGALCHLLARLRPAVHAFVGSDSGCLHLAAACGLSTLGLYGPQDPARTAPTSPAVRILFHPDAADCIPCSRRDCDQEVSAACMQSIKIPEVLGELLRITENRAAGDETTVDPGNIGHSDSDRIHPESGLTAESRQVDKENRTGIVSGIFDRNGLVLGGILALAVLAFLIAVLRGGPLSNAETDVVNAAAQIWPQAKLPVPELKPMSSPCCPGVGHMVIGGFLRILGPSPLAARLPSVVAGLGLLAITYLLARRLSDHTTGLVAVLVLLGMHGLYTGACTVNIDMPAALCIGAAALLYLESSRGTTTISQAAVPLAALAAVLAALIQGPSGLLIPAFVLVAFHAAERNLKPLFRPVFLISALGALAVIGVWISFLGISRGQGAMTGIAFFLHMHTPATLKAAVTAALAPFGWMFVDALIISLPAPFALYAHFKIRRYREDLGFGDRRWRLPKAALLAGLTALVAAPGSREGAVLSLLPFLSVLVASWLVAVIRSHRSRSTAAG